VCAPDTGGAGICRTQAAEFSVQETERRRKTAAKISATLITEESFFCRLNFKRASEKAARGAQHPPSDAASRESPSRLTESSRRRSASAPCLRRLFHVL
jgi:hypothetical protein